MDQISGKNGKKNSQRSLSLLGLHNPKPINYSIGVALSLNQNSTDKAEMPPQHSYFGQLQNEMQCFLHPQKTSAEMAEKQLVIKNVKTETCDDMVDEMKHMERKIKIFVAGSDENIMTYKHMEDELVKAQMSNNKLNEELQQVKQLNQEKLEQLRCEVKTVSEEKQKILKENQQIKKDLRNTKHNLDELRNLETQLKIELKTMADENGEIKGKLKSAIEEMGQLSQELGWARNVLNIKENAYNKFVEEFARGEERDAASESSEMKGRSLEQVSNMNHCLVCSICMKPSGEHDLCSLACGHFFGKSCITQWIKQEGRKRSKCPKCSKRLN